MGFLMPKPPRAPAPRPIAPAPTPPPAAKGAAGPDPTVFKTARERATEAEKRLNRDKLRIPLNTFAGGTSGLQI
jgi:hypothetical protein